MNQPSDLHHLAGAYALDAATAEERIAFESHYPDCDICVREVFEFRETAAILADGAGTDPPGDLKQRIMTGVTRTQQLPVILPDRVIDLAEQRRHRTNWASVLVGAAAAAIIAIVGTVAALRPGTQGDDISQLLASPDAVVSTLDGAEGTVRVVWSSDRAELAVVGSGLGDPGPDLTYELWFVQPEGDVLPAGLFHPDEDGNVRTVLTPERFSGFTGFGVTIEPDGGSPQPTSDILFLGSF